MEKSNPSIYKKNSLSILVLHNRYQYGGGEDISTFQEVKTLQEMGQSVELVEWSNEQIREFSKLQKANLFFSSSWNPKSARWLKSKLSSKRPDILHVQNFFPLFSPSVHQAAHKLGVPTVQHLRNFRLGCLNAYLFRENKVCEDCVGVNPWRGVLRRCYRDSLPASLSIWQMISTNRLRRTWKRYVDAFITPSHFAAQKLQEIGIPENRLYVKPNFVADPLSNGSILPLPEIPTFLYVGRLSPEKGILTLLEAWKHLKKTEWKLILMGDGQQRAELESFCQENQLTNVEFRGYQPTETVLEAMRSATAVLVPSLWYETFGRVVVEAFACGRIVLVSDLGALSELVEDGITGFKIALGQVYEWVDKLKWCSEHLTQIEEMGHQARNLYLKKYTPETNYQCLMDIYNRVL